MRPSAPRLWVVAVAVLLIGVAVGFGAASFGKKEPALYRPRTPDYTVKLEKKGANPAYLSVVVGQMVEFDSRDGSYHEIVQVTDVDPKKYELVSHGYDSGLFAPDEGYQATFLKAGSFIFHDHLRPDLVITVDVHESTTTPK